MPLRRLIRSWRWRVAVAGHSMAPTLRDGDWLLVDPDAFRLRAPRVAELVVVADPRQPGRWLVKRVAALLADGRLTVAGDHPGHQGEEAEIGPVDGSALIGRPWLCYWPLRRLGRP